MPASSEGGKRWDREPGPVGTLLLSLPLPWKLISCRNRPGGPGGWGERHTVKSGTMRSRRPPALRSKQPGGYLLGGRLEDSSLENRAVQEERLIATEIWVLSTNKQVHALAPHSEAAQGPRMGDDH